MTVSIANPVFATALFSALGFLALFFSARRRNADGLFPPALTQELKGFAIIAVVLSHIGYFLFSDHRFLFPLSIFAGIGVDLFLFLSGFGLTASALRKPLSVGMFYSRRLLKLFIPLWISIVLFLLLDHFVLHISYPWSFVGQSVAGIFPHADIYSDLNSPLWYFTLILLYYLVFPLVFSRKYPWLSALALFGLGRLFAGLQPDFFSGVIGLYSVHMTAFPLGLVAAWILERHETRIISYAKKHGNKLLHACACLILTFVAGYSAVHSGVGKAPLLQEALSLVTMFAIMGLFMLKRFELKLLALFGALSYEIYLLHWPILYRYDFLFGWLPAWAAVLAYLAIFVLLAWGLQQLIALFERRNEIKK